MRRGNARSRRNARRIARSAARQGVQHNLRAVAQRRRGALTPRAHAVTAARRTVGSTTIQPRWRREMAIGLPGSSIRRRPSRRLGYSARAPRPSRPGRSRRARSRHYRRRDLSRHRCPARVRPAAPHAALHAAPHTARLRPPLLRRYGRVRRLDSATAREQTPRHGSTQRAHPSSRR